MGTSCMWCDDRCCGCWCHGDMNQDTPIQIADSDAHCIHPTSQMIILLKIVSRAVWPNMATRIQVLAWCLCGARAMPEPIYPVLLVSSIYDKTRARFLSLAPSKLRLCSANHRPGYWCNLACDWQSTAWAYSEQETENGPRWLVLCFCVCVSVYFVNFPLFFFFTFFFLDLEFNPLLCAIVYVLMFLYAATMMVS